MECAHVPNILIFGTRERERLMGWVGVLLSTSPCGSFPLGIEENSSNWEAKVIVLSESSSTEVIP